MSCSEGSRDGDVLDTAFGCCSDTFDVEGVQQFIEKQRVVGRRIVVVTSGGTQAPLEARVVRSLDNFSTGMRGATATEEFLRDTRYAVIFLGRKGSAMPFARRFPHPDLTDANRYAMHSSGSSLIVCDTEAVSAWKELRSMNAADRIFPVIFVTVQQYLCSLRSIAKCCDAMGHNVVFFLAAAVSDFYVPPSQLPEHKISSGDGKLTLTLYKVPKCLGLLRELWAPKALMISFKVSTTGDVVAKFFLRFDVVVGLTTSLSPMQQHEELIVP